MGARAINCYVDEAEVILDDLTEVLLEDLDIQKRGNVANCGGKIT